MRNGIKRFEGDTLAFVRVISVSVQEFKNVLGSLCVLDLGLKLN